MKFVTRLSRRLGLRSVLLVLSALALLLPRSARATDYYVATTGSDANAGTLAAPFASLQKGVDAAAAGDTVYIRGGTYKIVNGASDMSGVNFSKSGQSDAMRIHYWAYQDEHPIFDFSGLKLSSTKTCAGFYVTGSWLHFKGLEISYVPMPGTVSNNGLWSVGASHNTYELLNLHHNNGPGLSIANGTGGHLILNCDSHDNYDPNSKQGAGQNADGFGCHYQTSGTSTVYRGCRSWWNSDDGYDLISQEYPVTIENCWAMGNGYINSGTARPASGNGNGFKAGSSKTGVRHTIRNSLAWKNGAAGFYANHSSGGNDWFNNTSYNNSVQYNMLASPAGDSGTTIILSGALAHKMRNNIGFPDKNSNMGGVDTASNTWDLKIVPASGDFVSVSDTGFMGARQADGSLPDVDYMKLAPGSQMIDKGVNVNLPFVGAAPDLGAFEYGATTSAGSGGGSSSAGGPGVAGSSGMTGVSGADGESGGSGPVGSAGSGELAGGPASPSGGSGPDTTGGSAGGNPVTGTAGGPAGPASGNDDASSSGSCAVRAGAEHGSWASLLATLAAVGLVAKRRRFARSRRA